MSSEIQVSSTMTEFSPHSFGEAALVIGSLAALIMGGIGLSFLLGEPDRIVGADAYNYLISTNRGIGLLAGSATLAIIAVGVLLFDRLRGDSK